MANISEVFPEYYVLKVNGFDDLAKDTLDEWIYFLKNSEIKNEFSAEGLQKAAEELDILKLSKVDRMEYDRYLEDKRVAESSMKTPWLEGKIEGKSEGKIEVAVEMIHDGESNDRIGKYTGLTDSEINALRK